ncbi:ABC transporter permease [Kocuria atrinae]|uniref:ABC transporter permease n=1 Tax=Kocuria atrinae TaxID=592377 RepID=UPI00030387A9|nr:ABC transporter permease [Kocuria atrinae]
MNVIRIEFLKLKGSLSWLVVVLLPVMAVFSGSLSTLSSGGEFEDGWHTLWIRSIGFYGMALLPIGIGILASLVWRPEHRNGNWNALMSQSVPTHKVVLSKVVAISTLTAAMQVVMLLTVLVMGKLAFQIPGWLPSTYWLGSLLIVVGCIPVVALQSAFSTFLRSFAVPVAIALIGAGISTVALMVGLPAVIVSPYALATYTTQLGTTLVSGESTVFNAAAMTPGSVALVVSLGLLLTVLIVAATTAVHNKRDASS